MIKNDLVNRVTEETGVARIKAARAVETVIETMRRSLALGGRIEPEQILRSYRAGVFPSPAEDGKADGNALNEDYPSVAQVRRLCRREFGVTPEFDRGVTYRFVQRALVDPSFQRRHGLGLARLAFLVPPGAQPAMSCRITRPR